MQLHTLFPETVGAFQLEREISKTELNFVESLSKIKNLGNMRSEESYILENKKMKKLKDFFLECTYKFFDEIYQPLAEDYELYVTQSWANYNEKGMWHHNHTHSGSILSGVFFINATEDVDKIMFHKKSSYELLKITSRSFNQHNSGSWWLPAKTNTLYLFQSNLEHSVPQIDPGLPVYSTRISISFNTFIKGTFGSNQNLTELVLE